MGSLCCAHARIGLLTTSDRSGGIAAGQRAVSPVGCSPSQRIALTLGPFDLFAMTSHVECVALLEKTGSDLRRSDSR